MNSFFYQRSVHDGQEVASFLFTGSEYLCGNVDDGPYVPEHPSICRSHGNVTETYALQHSNV